MKCPHCTIQDPTWDHIAWHARRKRNQERAHEKEIESQEREHRQRRFSAKDS